MGDSEDYIGDMTSTQLCYWFKRYKTLFLLMTCDKFDLHYYYYHFFIIVVTIVIFILTLVCGHFSLTKYSCWLVMFIRDRTVVEL